MYDVKADDRDAHVAHNAQADRIMELRSPFGFAGVQPKVLVRARQDGPSVGRQSLSVRPTKSRREEMPIRHKNGIGGVIGAGGYLRDSTFRRHPPVAVRRNPLDARKSVFRARS